MSTACWSWTRRAPTTTDDATTAWYNPSSRLTLTATDNSYVAQTLYRVDGGTMQKYTAPFAVPGDGEAISVEYLSIDGSGNQETTKTATVKVDSTPPVSSSDAQSSYVDSGTVSFSATDTLSRVSRRRSTTSTARAGWTGRRYGSSATATTRCSIRAVDVAGNVESPEVGVGSHSPRDGDVHDQLARADVVRDMVTYDLPTPSARTRSPPVTTSPASAGPRASKSGRTSTTALASARVDLGWPSVLGQPGHRILRGPVLDKVYDSGQHRRRGSLPDGRRHGGYGRINVQRVVVEGVFGGEVADHEPPTTTSNIPATWTASPFSVRLTQTDYLEQRGTDLLRRLRLPRRTRPTPPLSTTEPVLGQPRGHEPRLVLLGRPVRQRRDDQDPATPARLISPNDHSRCRGLLHEQRGDHADADRPVLRSRVDPLPDRRRAVEPGYDAFGGRRQHR